MVDRNALCYTVYIATSAESVGWLARLSQGTNCSVEVIRGPCEWLVHIVEHGRTSERGFVSEGFAQSFAEGQRARLRLTTTKASTLPSPCPASSLISMTAANWCATAKVWRWSLARAE